MLSMGGWSKAPKWTIWTTVPCHLPFPSPPPPSPPCHPVLQVTQLVNVLASVHLSSQYMDMVKDRLYADDPASPRRQSAQVMVSPPPPLHSWTLTPHPYTPFALCELQVNIVNERARKEGAIGSGLQSRLTLTVPPAHPVLPHLHALAACGDLCDVLGASQVTVVEGVAATAATAATATATATGSGGAPVAGPIAGGVGGEAGGVSWGACVAPVTPGDTQFRYRAVAVLPGSKDPLG